MQYSSRISGERPAKLLTSRKMAMLENESREKHNETYPGRVVNQLTPRNQRGHYGSSALPSVSKQRSAQVGHASGHLDWMLHAADQTALSFLNANSTMRSSIKPSLKREIW